MGAVLAGSPNANEENLLHPGDCADLLCYNNAAEDGQHYDRCGGSPVDTWAGFVARYAARSVPAGARVPRCAYALTVITTAIRAIPDCRMRGC